jgi:PAS domain S-box-containing protein
MRSSLRLTTTGTQTNRTLRYARASIPAMNISKMEESTIFVMTPPYVRRLLLEHGHDASHNRATTPARHDTRPHATTRNDPASRRRVAPSARRKHTIAGPSPLPEHEAGCGESRIVSRRGLPITTEIGVQTTRRSRGRSKPDFEMLARELPFLVYAVCTDGPIPVTYVSDEMERRLFGGKRPKRFELGDVVHPDDRERVLEEHGLAATERHLLASEFRIGGSDPTMLRVRARPVPDRQADGSAVLQGYCADVSFQIDTEQRLRASEAQFRALVANIPGVVYRCECDGDWTIRFMSDDIEDIVGYPAREFVGNSVRAYGSVIHPEDRPAVREQIDEAFRRGVADSLEYRLIHADGSHRWIAEHGRAIPGPRGEKLWLDGVILDISKRKAAEQVRDAAEAELKRQAELKMHEALHDSLTGLPNRTLFGDRLRQAVFAAEREGTEFALLSMDLDRFKEINDTLGHTAPAEEFCYECAGGGEWAARPSSRWEPTSSIC